MRKLTLFVMLISLLTLSVLPAVPRVSPTSPPIARSPSTMRSPIPVTANQTTDWFANGDFERWDSPTGAELWGESTTDNLYTWYAEAPWPIKSGSYSAGLQANSEPGGTTVYASIYPNLPDVDMRALNFTCHWYSDQTQNIGSDRFYIDIGVYGGGNYYSLVYMLNGTLPGITNTSSQGTFLVGGPTQQWNRFSRNLSADFEAIPGWPSITAAHVMYNLRFQMLSTTDTTQWNRAFIDDVVLENDTTTWINGTIREGGFEAAGYWNIGFGEYPSYLSRSTTAHSGSFSCNMTATSNGNMSEAYLYYYDARPRITLINQGNLSFWWYLDYEYATDKSKSYFQFYIYNSTNNMRVYYMLGYGGTSSPETNTSNTFVLHVENFNTTGQWFYSQRNIWQDASAYFGTDELYLSSTYFYCISEDGGSRTTTLLDDMHLMAGTNNGRGFEDQPAVGSRIRGLSTPNSDSDALRVTGTAFAGSKAANLTLTNGAYLNTEHDLGYRYFHGERDTYLDVMWRLQDYTPTASDYAYLRINLRNNKRMTYYLAYAEGQLPSNTTSYAYFAVSGANTLDSWMQMHRNLTTDYEAVFDSRPDTSLRELTVAGYTSGSNRLELLLDDLHIYDLDGSAPYISEVTQFPLAPAYTQAVVVTATVVDQESALSNVDIHCRLNNGSWLPAINMAHLGGNTYQGVIPAFPINTLVEYYINATNADTLSRIAVDDDNYYQYLVTDILIPLTSLLLGSAVVVIIGLVIVFVYVWFQRRQR